jgi:hypothetical protein
MFRFLNRTARATTLTDVRDEINLMVQMYAVDSKYRQGVEG